MVTTPVPAVASIVPPVGALKRTENVSLFSITISLVIEILMVFTDSFGKNVTTVFPTAVKSPGLPAEPAAVS
ncbi:hypothetical protein D3C80_1754070 [compost metagenome]